MSDADDNLRLREALSRVATAVGAHAAPTCSIDFLCSVPREVELVMERTHTRREIRAQKREQEARAEAEQLRKVLAETTTERELRAFRREKAARDEVESLHVVIAGLRAEIASLSQALHEECA